jgi:hypothetical protein
MDALASILRCIANCKVLTGLDLLPWDALDYQFEGLTLLLVDLEVEDDLFFAVEA